MAGLQEMHRPKSFDQILGNEAAISSIISMLHREFENIPQTWLFYGPRGCGKTTIARIMKTELKCGDLSFFEHNAAKENGIGAIREIAANCNLGALDGSCKIYLIDECHRLTTPAQESFLKTLEDTPENTFFFLCTTDPDMLRPAIRSRCQFVKVVRQSPRKITEYLNKILEKENVTDLPPDIIQAISKNCEGATRDAMILLDSIIDMKNMDQAMEVVVRGVQEKENGMYDVYRAITDKGTFENKWKIISPILKKLGSDVEGSRRHILSLLRKDLIDTGNEHLVTKMSYFETNFFDSGLAGLAMACRLACN